MSAFHEDRALAEAAAEALKAYAQPQRLMILSYLLQGEHTVGEIESATGIGQPALSQQLAELRRAGLAKTRRAAKQVFYSLADERVALTVSSVEALFGGRRAALSALRAAMVPGGAPSSPPRPAGAAAFVRLVTARS